MNRLDQLDKLSSWLSRPAYRSRLVTKISEHLHRLYPILSVPVDSSDLICYLEEIESFLEKLVMSQESSNKAFHPYQKEANESLYSHPTDMSKALIELRDWVLLAKTQSGENILAEHFYERLGNILSESGIQTIEDTGTVDYNRHQVLAMEATTDPALNEAICETIRPGYYFQNQILRPQQIKVYFYDLD